MIHTDCIFCKIIAGRADAHRVFEDQHTLAFMDLYPAADGHTLVIPKQHFVTLFDIDDQHVAAVARSARRIAAAMRTVWAPDGLTASQANGRAAGQTVGHYHVHLIPRADGQRMQWHGQAAASADDLAARASVLREALEV
ncbi:MAG: HIT domain-containing protein [Pseudomonadota bacterium]